MTGDGRVVALSSGGAAVAEAYDRHLRANEALAAPTLRNYLLELHHFAAWYETSFIEGGEQGVRFHPVGIGRSSRSWVSPTRASGG